MAWLCEHRHHTASRQAAKPARGLTDIQGSLLPIWPDRRVLNADEFFVFSGRIPNSFDSRCYGPIQRTQIDAVTRRPKRTIEAFSVQSVAP